MAHRHLFSVAPMMDWTDSLCRRFHRLLSAQARLYTEMVTADAIVHGDAERHLTFHADEHPVALQLGGAEPDKLARAAVIARGYGYDEINLNVGCPSDRVQSGRFGACLMREPALVADCVAALRSESGVEVTVKCRIGVDDQDPAAVLPVFLDAVAAAGCQTFIIHARKAWLRGLSPKENRTVPPLDYGLVRRMKTERPDLAIVLNGGIGDLDSAAAELRHVDGVMLGRAAYQNPYLLAEVDSLLFGGAGPAMHRAAVVRQLLPIAEEVCAGGGRLHHLTRHILGLYQGRPGARAWRRVLSEGASDPAAGPALLLEALAAVEPDAAAEAQPASGKRTAA